MTLGQCSFPACPAPTATSFRSKRLKRDVWVCVNHLYAMRAADDEWHELERDRIRRRKADKDAQTALFDTSTSAIMGDETR